jgi:hypothetical protein
VQAVPLQCLQMFNMSFEHHEQVGHRSPSPACISFICSTQWRVVLAGPSIAVLRPSHMPLLTCRKLLAMAATCWATRARHSRGSAAVDTRASLSSGPVPAYAYLCIYVFVYIIYESMYICIHTCTCVCVCVLCVWVWVWVWVCVCVCVCV